MAKERDSCQFCRQKNRTHTQNDDEQTALKTNQYRKSSFFLVLVFFFTWKQLTRSRVLFSTDSYEKNSVHRRR